MATTALAPDSDRRASALLLRAGFLTGVIDGLFSSALAAFAYGSTVTRLFQGVASTLIGASAMTGGTPTAALGVLMHFGVAFGWSAVFLALTRSSRWLRELLRSPLGAFKVAAVYGPAIWMVMSLAVIPALVHRPPAINIRWWIQLIGHFPFVGLPIVLSLRSIGTR